MKGQSPLKKLCFLLFFNGESKEGEASLIQLIPLPLIKGKGIKGIGLQKTKGGVRLINTLVFEW